MIEQKTIYTYKLKSLEHPSFDKVMSFAKKIIDDLPKSVVDELFQDLERGVVQIDDEPHMFVYLYSYGKMHKAKLDCAFAHLPNLFYERTEINIIDYGCGQAIGTMCYVDFLLRKNIRQKIKRVTLIEPSEICLKRAALHVSKFCPDAEIITLNKTFDELSYGDIVCEDTTSNLHILSNVLDIDFLWGNFARLIKDSLKGHNQFVCVGPYFNLPQIDCRMDKFADFFRGNNDFDKVFDKFQLNPDKPWTAHIRCFSIKTSSISIEMPKDKNYPQIPLKYQKIKITRENGETVDAQAPMIISASRSTDIPAFYADWFFYRLGKGYSAWTNPFNGIRSYVSYKNARFYVFWSKNPKPLLQHTDELKKMNFYIQFTLNDYVSEGLEKGVPPLEDRIATFKQLVETFGKGRVIWRFDPLILTDKITVNDLLHKVENIGDQLKDYTEKLVFSFVDIAYYKKVKFNLEKNNINYYEWTENEMVDFAQRLAELNKKWNYQLATCGEKIDIAKYGIKHNKCVDDDLIIRFAKNDEVLMDYLGVEIVNSLFEGEKIVKKKDNSDKGQRQFCGCIVSKDVGEYNTCPYLCEYCNVNTSKEVAVSNYNQAKGTGLMSETITGK